VLGLAGTIPYLGTSISTIYLTWALGVEGPLSSGFLNSLTMSHESAQYWLDLIEPLQLGYGAVIISFLGAIHWGLEYAEKQPSASRTRFRYGMGVLASVVAWPTLLMPINFALTSQFAAFVALYFADARATVRGWAPAWYSSYRFALTAVVGVAIAISLIGRTKVGDAKTRMGGLGEHGRDPNYVEQPYDEKWEKLEIKEKEKVKKEKEAAEKKKKEEERKAKQAEMVKDKGDKGGKGGKGESKGKDEKGDQGEGDEKHDASKDENKD
jgi:hypothetical protein